MVKQTPKNRKEKSMGNMENLVIEEEMTENTEEPTVEEVVENEPEIVQEEPEKKYSDADVDAIVARKIARERSKITREMEEKYAPHREAEAVLNAGLKTSNIAEATARMREFYKDKGVEIPEYQAPSYNEEDLRVLAENEAQKIIESGYEDVVDEVDRLAAKGIKNMTPREKLVFRSLAEHREAEGRRQELLKIGVKEDVISSKEFRDFAKQFTSETPIANVYKLYEKTLDKPHIEQIGSMTNTKPGEEKTFYTPEEVDKLTSKDLDDPKIFQRVRESMKRWK